MKPAENKEEQRTYMFGDLYRNGFEMLVIDNGQTFLAMSLFDIIEKLDFSNVPEISRLIMNPALVCAANCFFQSLSTKDVRRDLEANMFREIYNAKYLMPLDASEMNMEKTNTDSGECVIKEKSIMQFPLITNSEDKSFYPFFTDWNEFRRFDKEQNYSGNIAVFNDIKYFIDKADGISINPYGVNITLTKDMLSIIENVVKDSSQNMSIKEQVAEKDTKVILGEPSDYPQKMIDEICKYLKTNKNVNAAYLRLMIKDNEQSYLIVVDFSGDKNDVFSGIANAGVPFFKGKYLDFVPLLEDFGRTSVENVDPFYKKKKFRFFG